MVMRQGAPHGNRYAESRGFIFDRQTPEWFSLAKGVMNETPMPDIVLGLGPGLNGATRTECSPALTT